MGKRSRVDGETLKTAKGRAETEQAAGRALGHIGKSLEAIAKLGDLEPYLLGKFKETRNPLFAWIAFRRARQKNRPPPEWVLKYLDSAGDGLMDRAKKGRGDSVDIAKAIGFSARESSRSEFARYSIFEGDLAIADEVDEARNRLGTLWEAREAVAAARGCSAKKIERAEKRARLFNSRPLHEAV